MTEEGHAFAERLMRRHRLMERFLTDVLGLDWRQAHEEAERLEHAVSSLLEERLAAVLGDPPPAPTAIRSPAAGVPACSNSRPKCDSVNATPVKRPR